MTGWARCERNVGGKKGRKEGRKEGKKEGKKEGRKKGNICKKTQFTSPFFAQGDRTRPSFARNRGARLHCQACHNSGAAFDCRSEEHPELISQLVLWFENCETTMVAKHL